MKTIIKPVIIGISTAFTLWALELVDIAFYYFLAIGLITGLLFLLLDSL